MVWDLEDFRDHSERFEEGKSRSDTPVLDA